MFWKVLYYDVWNIIVRELKKLENIYLNLFDIKQGAGRYNTIILTKWSLKITQRKILIYNYKTWKVVLPGCLDCNANGWFVMYNGIKYLCSELWSWFLRVRNVVKVFTKFRKLCVSLLSCKRLKRWMRIRREHVWSDPSRAARCVWTMIFIGQKSRNWTGLPIF